MSNTDKQVTLNLEVKNNRRGEWTLYHRKVDVYLNGKFISTYQYNPFIGTDAKQWLLMGKGFSAHYNALGRALYNKYSTNWSDIQKMFNIWLGNVYKTKFYDDKILEILDLVEKHTTILDPELYNVESCLILDATSFMEARDFKDFCDNFGYSDDSIKALEAYNACKDIFVALVQAIGTEKIKELNEVHLED